MDNLYNHVQLQPKKKKKPEVKELVRRPCSATYYKIQKDKQQIESEISTATQRPQTSNKWSHYINNISCQDKVTKCSQNKLAIQFPYYQMKQRKKTEEEVQEMRNSCYKNPKGLSLLKRGISRLVTDIQNTERSEQLTKNSMNKMSIVLQNVLGKLTIFPNDQKLSTSKLLTNESQIKTTEASNYECVDPVRKPGRKQKYKATKVFVPKVFTAIKNPFMNQSHVFFEDYMEKKIIKKDNDQSINKLKQQTQKIKDKFQTVREVFYAKSEKEKKKIASGSISMRSNPSTPPKIYHNMDIFSQGSGEVEMLSSR